MYHVLLGVTGVIVICAVLIFIMLIGQKPPAFVTQGAMIILLPSFILMAALYGGLAYIVKELSVLAERIRDISREMRKLKN